MPHVLRLAVVVVAVLGCATPVAAASSLPPDPTLTPSGPATVRAYWNGPVTLEGRPPEVLVGWTVTVGQNSKAGPVRLRVLHPGPTATVKASGPVESLPADPGTYRFSLPVGIPYDPRDSGLALDQEVGGHAILEVSQRSEDEVHLFESAVLAEDAHGVTPSHKYVSRRMAITGITESDVDRDLRGDQTQDVGDLKVLSARITGRRANGAFGVEARVRNVGTTTRHIPRIAAEDPTTFLPCFAGCVTAPLAPGQETVLYVEYLPADRRAPTQVAVKAEGPDLTPADNTVALPPFLTLAKAAGPTPRVRLGSNRAGTITLTARVAGIRITRTVTFAKADRRVVRLLPATRADRRRLARALRRPGRLAATVTAKLGDGTAVLRLRV